MFTQFLAWQRLMQLVDVVPPPEIDRMNANAAKGNENAAKGNDEAPRSKRGDDEAPRSKRGDDEVSRSKRGDDEAPRSKKRKRDEGHDEKPSDRGHDEKGGNEKSSMEMPPPQKRSRVDDSPPIIPPLKLPPADSPPREAVNSPVNQEALEEEDVVAVNDPMEEDEDEDGDGDGESAPVTPRPGDVVDRYDPATPRTPAETPRQQETPIKYTPAKFALKPADTIPRAVISGDGIWGEHFRFELHQKPTGFMIGRKNPSVDLDMSEYTDVRTVSHRHCMFVFNRKLNVFQIENYGRNGTRLNNELFGKSGSARRNLNNGDIIEVGKVQIKFELLKDNDEAPKDKPKDDAQGK
jgi:hypothetical protein